MRSYHVRLPSPALIVACLALFAALGGGAYAATSSSSSSIHWKNAALKNGWTPYASGYAPAGYAKDSSGVVHLRGGIKGGTSGSIAFTLPKADRPHHALYLPIYTLDGSEGSLYISKGGHVEPFGSEVSGYTSLDGVSFAAGE